MSGPVHVVIDAPGLKVYGTGEILGSGLIRNEDSDASHLRPLLNQIPGPIASVTADGTYDQDRIYESVAERHPEAAVFVPSRAPVVPGGTAETEPT